MSDPDVKQSAVVQDSRAVTREQMFLEETVIPSINSIDLEHSPRLDYLTRVDSNSPHIAELYQENSKLTPSHPGVPLVFRGSKLEEMRSWYFSTAYAPRPEDIDFDKAIDVTIHRDTLPVATAAVLEAFARPGTMADLLYGVDLFLLHEQRVLRVLAHRDVLWVERRVSPQISAQLADAILDVPSSALGGCRTYMFLVACAWRYMLLYGPRGYRHTLLDVGRLLDRLESAAASSGASTRTSVSFYDHKIDRILALDGVERTTMAIVALSS